VRFFFDENFPKAAAEVLERYSHEWIDPRGSELEGADDSILVEEAQRNSAVILTTDRDFFHTLRHQNPSHAGLIVIALKQPNRSAILDRLQWLLENIDEDQIPGRAFQLRDKDVGCAAPNSRIARR
jgi:predicted nuclease of predicted toxin-antitoxin system